MNRISPSLGPNNNGRIASIARLRGEHVTIFAAGIDLGAAAPRIPSLLSPRDNCPVAHAHPPSGSVFIFLKSFQLVYDSLYCHEKLIALATLFLPALDGLAELAVQPIFGAVGVKGHRYF